MKRLTMKSTLLLTLFVVGGPVAAAEPAVYLGGGLGSASTDRSGYDNAGSSKFFVGANAEGFGMELAYVNLGRFKQNSINNYSVDGAQLNAIGELFLSKGLNGYGSFGFYNWDLDDNLTTGDSGTSLTIGLGMKVIMGRNFAVRGGWDRYQDVSDTNIDMFSLNGIFQF